MGNEGERGRPEQLRVTATTGADPEHEFCRCLLPWPLMSPSPFAVTFNIAVALNVAVAEVFNVTFEN